MKKRDSWLDHKAPKEYVLIGCVVVGVWLFAHFFSWAMGALMVLK